MVLPPKTTDTQPAKNKGIAISTLIRSAKSLTDWRGSYTTFKGFTGTLPEKEIPNAPWEEFKQEICPENPALITDKHKAEYFIPCLLKDAPLVGKTLEKATQNGEATIGKMRSKSHVTKSTAVVIDVDGMTEEAFQAGRTKLEADGLTYLAYTTHSHGKPDKPGMRVRIIIPVDRPINIEDYRLAWHALDNRYFDGQVGKADSSGANLYQQQGTWCCHPSRQNLAETWENTAGIASVHALLGQAPKATQVPVQQTDNKYPTADANKIADNCKQIGLFREHKGAGQSEPLWRASLGIVGSCENGEALCQDWSSGHRDYSQIETAKKLAARQQIPPTTCNHLREINPDGCIGCVQTCRSPIRLGMEIMHEHDVSELADGAPAEPEAPENKGALLFEEVDPYPKPINPGQLFIAIAVLIRRYIVIDREQADAVALWIVLTWVVDHVEVLALLVVNAPEKACGKTQLLDFISRLAYRPLPVSNISPAAVFRSIDALQPSLLIDEADTFFKDKPELSGLFNCGHTRTSAFVIRSTGEDHTPKAFSVWGAKAFAGIDLERHFSDATLSRSILINMRRKMPGETVERMRHADRNVFVEIKSKLARFAADYGDQISKARPNLPDELSDRAQDNWEPLLAIAECAGPEWVDRATNAALKLSVSESSVSIAIELLTDIRDIFEVLKGDKIKTADLIEDLVRDDERPWATFSRGNDITPRQLANQLKKFGIKSKTVRFGRETPKGYDRGQFEDVFARYLPQDLPQRRNDFPEPMPAVEYGVADDTQQMGNAKLPAATPPTDAVFSDY